MSAVLSDREIIKEIANNRIVLYDPDRGNCIYNIQNSSVDITLGNWIYRSKVIPVLNPWNQDHIKEYWGTQQSASIATHADIETLGLVLGQQYIRLEPGETILGHTQEFIGGRDHITTMMKARSSLGRSNVTICRDAGWGDIGYINRWTLEITNNGTSPVILPVGARVGQIIFLYTGTPDTSYKGKYQSHTSIDDIVKAWNPSMMLPKLYMDKEFCELSL